MFVLVWWSLSPAFVLTRLIRNQFNIKHQDGYNVRGAYSLSWIIQKICFMFPYFIISAAVNCYCTWHCFKTSDSYNVCTCYTHCSQYTVHRLGPVITRTISDFLRTKPYKRITDNSKSRLFYIHNRPRAHLESLAHSQIQVLFSDNWITGTKP